MLGNILQTLRQLPSAFFGRILRPTAGAAGVQERVPQLAEELITKDRIIARLSAGSKKHTFLPISESYTEETQEMRQTYRVMLRDPHVKAAVFTKILSVAALDIQAQPGGDRPIDKDAADFCKWALQKARGGTRGLITSILTGGLIEGYSVAEKVYRVAREGRWAGKYTLDALKAKDPAELDILGDEFRNLTGIRDRRTQTEYHPDQFVFFRHMPLYESLAGMSDFRAAYRAYWLKDTAWKLRAIGLERYTLPMMKGTYAAQEDKAALEEALSQCRSQGWISLPETARVEAMELAIRGQADFEQAIRNLDEEIVIGISGAVLQMLQGQVSDGRGSSETHRGTAELYQWDLAATVGDIFTGQLVPDLVSFNFNGAAYPTITLGGVNDNSMTGALAIDEGLLRMGLPLSKSEMYTKYGRQEPTEEEDKLMPPSMQQGGIGMQPGGFGGLPQGGGFMPSGGSFMGEKDPLAEFGEDNDEPDHDGHGGVDLFAWQPFKTRRGTVGAVDGEKKVYGKAAQKMLAGNKGRGSAPAPVQAKTPQNSQEINAALKDAISSDSYTPDLDQVPVRGYTQHRLMKRALEVPNGRLLAGMHMAGVITDARFLSVATPKEMMLVQNELAKKGVDEASGAGMARFTKELLDSKPGTPAKIAGVRDTGLGPRYLLDAGGEKVVVDANYVEAIEKRHPKAEMQVSDKGNVQWQEGGRTVAVLVPMASPKDNPPRLGRRASVTDIVGGEPQKTEVVSYRGGKEIKVYGGEPGDDRRAVLEIKRERGGGYSLENPIASSPVGRYLASGLTKERAEQLASEMVAHAYGHDPVTRDLVFRPKGGAESPLVPEKSTPAPKLPPPSPHKSGDFITFKPHDKAGIPVSGQIVDEVQDQGGRRGWNVLIDDPADPGKVLRVWEDKGTINKGKPSTSGQETDFDEGDAGDHQVWPAEVLNLPIVYQEASYDCGAAAVKSAAEFLGEPARPLWWYVRILGSNQRDGTRPSRIVSFFADRGYRVSQGKMSPALLKLHTQAGRPVICPFQQSGDDTILSQGHYIVVAGVDDEFIYLQDPSNGPVKLPLGLFLERWEDVDADGRLYLRHGIAVGRQPEDFGEDESGGFEPEAGTVRVQPEPEKDVAGPIKDAYKVQLLLNAAEREGIRTLEDITTSALKRHLAEGSLSNSWNLYNQDELQALTQALSKTIGTSNLLGRYRVYQLKGRVEKLGESDGIDKFSDEPVFTSFADTPLRPLTPELAVDYFRSLNPQLNVEPQRFGLSMRRDAFTLAKATSQKVLERVKELIAQALETGEDIRRTGMTLIPQVLDQAGVTTRNPQYCFLPGTMVEGAVVAASKANYDGPAVEIEADNGRRLSVTVNHPVLTSVGWKAAGDIQEGDDLLCYGSNIKPLTNQSSFSVLASAKGRAVNNQQAPARIEDVFQSILEKSGPLGNIECPVTPLDFHGDGPFLEGNIHCVRTNGELQVIENANGTQRGRKVAFVNRLIGATEASGVGGGLHDFGTNALSSPSLASDEVPELFGLPFVRNVAPVATHNIGMAANIDPCLFKATNKTTGGDSQLFRDLVNGLPGFITVNRVVKIKRIWFTGHVYNLQTKTGFIVSEGIVTSNCEMVFRTNSMDAYTTGTMEAMQDPEVADLFPVWQYLGIRDGRQRPEHEVHFGKYFPNAVAFATVRDSIKVSPWNCRCGPNPVSKYRWRQLQAQGAKVESAILPQAAVAFSELTYSQCGCCRTFGEKPVARVVTWKGLKVNVEHPKGTIRTGTDGDGLPWSRLMQADYGYLPRYEGADGDHVDVYLGPDLASDTVWVIDQVKADGSFDEHKAMVGFGSWWEAERAYLKHLPEDWTGYVGGKAMPSADFKAWLAFGDLGKPIAAKELSQFAERKAAAVPAPPAPAPIINVAPPVVNVEVRIPQPTKKTQTIMRDENDNMKTVEEAYEYGDDPQTQAE